MEIIDPITMSIVAGSAVKAMSSLIDISQTGARKEAIRLGAESKKTAIKINSAIQKTDILQNQKEIDSQLINYMGATSIEAYNKGYDVTQSLYALARSANVVKEKNAQVMENIGYNEQVQMANVDIESAMANANLASQNLNNLFSAVGAGVQAYGQASNYFNSGSSTSPNINNIQAPSSARNRRY